MKIDTLELQTSLAFAKVPVYVVLQHCGEDGWVQTSMPFTKRSEALREAKNYFRSALRNWFEVIEVMREELANPQGLEHFSGPFPPRPTPRKYKVAQDVITLMEVNDYRQEQEFQDALDENEYGFHRRMRGEERKKDRGFKRRMRRR
jgi:hypothetical protein